MNGLDGWKDGWMDVSCHEEGSQWRGCFLWVNNQVRQPMNGLDGWKDGWMDVSSR